MKRIKGIRFLYIWIAALLAATFVLQTPAHAGTADRNASVLAVTSRGEGSDVPAPEDTEAETGTAKDAGAKSETPEEKEIRVFIQDAGQKKDDAVTVSGLRISLDEKTEQEKTGREKIGQEKIGQENIGQEKTEQEKPGQEAEEDREDIEELVEESLYIPEGCETATVSSAEGMSWEIPLFWTDENNSLAAAREPGQVYKPVLAFFVPQEYAVRSEEKNGFTVTLDAWLSGLYEAAGGAVCFNEPQMNITYILAVGTDLEYLEGKEGKLPAEPIPGLPDDLQKPSDGTYHNPSKDSGSALSGEDGNKEDESGSGDSEEQDLIGIGDGSQETGDDSAASDDIDGSNPSETEDTSDTEDETAQSVDESGTDDSAGTDGSSETDDASQADDSEEQDEEKEPLTREQLLGHCSSNTLKKYGEDEMANLVDLIINCIQPQAVELIKNSFPAFAQAAEEDALGREIGLYVYRIYGDKDGVKAHEDTSSRALAYVGYDISEDEQGKAEFSYVIGLNTYYFQYKDKDGNLHIDNSEQAAADLDNSIIHEMLHAFMYDYNRTGTIGTPDPEDYLKSKKDLQEARDVYEFPTWFNEGMASAVENVYQYRYEYFQLLRYEGDNVIGDRHTAENLLNTYLTNLFLLEDGEEYEDSYDIGAEDQTTTSSYVTGYLADLYLGELAARHENSASSVTVDENGNRTVSSETIRQGLNSILERLHKGETLDEIIRSISDGRYKNVSDFENKFIKGSDQQGDQDSISFCVDFLNYMQDIGRTSTNIPNGSILFDFDRDFTSPIDRSATAESDIYQITDSSDYVASTVDLSVPYTDGGKSENKASSGDSETEDDSETEKAPETEEVPEADDAVPAEDDPEAEDAATMEDVPEADDAVPAEDNPEAEDAATMEDVPEADDASTADDIPEGEDAPLAEDAANADASTADDNSSEEAGDVSQADDPASEAVVSAEAGGDGADESGTNENLMMAAKEDSAGEETAEESAEASAENTSEETSEETAEED